MVLREARETEHTYHAHTHTHTKLKDRSLFTELIKEALKWANWNEHWENWLLSRTESAMNECQYLPFVSTSLCLSLFSCPCLLLSVLLLCLDSSFSLHAPLSALQWQAPSLLGTARQNSSDIIEGTCKFPKDTFYSSFPLALLPVKPDIAVTNRHVFHVVTKSERPNLEL